MAAPLLPPTTLPPFAQRAWGGAFASGEWQDWRWQLAHRLTSVRAILDLLGDDFRVAPDVRAAMERAGAASEVSVTPCYLALARPDDPRDPILPQVLPDPAELDAAEQGSGVPDPFREEELEIAKGVVNRYPDRALFLLTNFCSTLCRHCMRRREWEGGFTRLSDAEIDAAVAAIAARPAIRDVLLSGGDPLNLPPSYVGKVVRALRERCDLDLLRLGSRVPVTLPMRIDDELLRELAPAAPLWLNTHFNHAREVTAEAAAALRRLAAAGVVVSNQGVLLRGINDGESDQLDLSRALLRAGVRAYYLHHCDPVQGVRHLRVGLARGIELIGSLQGKVSGLAIPRLTVDLPGGGGKVQADGPQLRERRGDTFVYSSPLCGERVAVDGSEGSFGGAGSWRVGVAAAGPL
ncbi:MAG: KamA family radical SAM protein [Planctomycetes bacterium]|nr:KamA family radical SAM protein [Planctomycetota bacterium]